MPEFDDTVKTMLEELAPAFDFCFKEMYEYMGKYLA
jgi:hypothetical protein